MPLYAHVKWFISEAARARADLPDFTFGESGVLVWLVAALALVALSWVLHPHLPDPPQLPTIWRPWLSRWLRICAGVSLVISSWNGVIIAPHYLPAGLNGEILRLLQFFSGTLLLLPGSAVTGAVALLLVYAGTLLQFGPVEALEYLNVAGIGVFLLFEAWPQTALRQRLQPYALPSLRVCTGLALITLGFSEKLLHPAYAQSFLDDWMWNFMRNLGMESFNDRLFVLSAGTMEVVFGCILVLGTTPRLNILAVSGFMHDSNLTFLVSGSVREAWTEIVGHLPIIGIAVVILALGSGPTGGNNRDQSPFMKELGSDSN